MLTCKDASHLISAHQERPLGFRERWGLRFHLWICANCRRFERQVRFLSRALREMGRRTEADAMGNTPDIDLPPDARERIRKALAERNSPQG